MSIDIVNLRQFYSSPLGRKVRRRLRRLVRDRWHTLSGHNTVGVGYTTDVLPLPSNAEQKDSRIVALMPDAQGAIYWPVDAANHSVLADVLRPPFMPASLHRVVLMHVLEVCPAPHELLQVWWQFLAPGGRMILIVPNRHGIWARFGATPFCSGNAYTVAQLRQLLNDAAFTVRDVRSACFAPPSTHPLWLNLFGVLEWLGASFIPRMGGVLIIEAEKQIYAGLRVTPTQMKPGKVWKGAPAMSKNP